jgi:hypothetical protein
LSQLGQFVGNQVRGQSLDRTEQGPEQQRRAQLGSVGNHERG